MIINNNNNNKNNNEGWVNKNRWDYEYKIDHPKVILLFIKNSQLSEINNLTILHMMTSSRDKGFIQIRSEYWRVPTTTNPLLQINRLVWHYSPGIYRSGNVCIVLRQEQRAAAHDLDLRA